MNSMINSKPPSPIWNYKSTSSNPNKKLAKNSKSTNKTSSTTPSKRNSNSSSTPMSPSTFPTPSMAKNIFSPEKLPIVSGFRQALQTPPKTILSPEDSPIKPKSNSKDSTRSSSSLNKIQYPASSDLISTSPKWESVDLIHNSLISSEEPLPPEDTPTKPSKNLASNTSKVSCFMDLQVLARP